MKLKRTPNSIDTLSPNDPFVKIMNALPLAKGVPYHSIIGDRGRGDTPNSGDGVVPYWSSHVGGAKSEKIVPADHGANQNPKGIAEAVRILKEHIDSILDDTTARWRAACRAAYRWRRFNLALLGLRSF